MITIDISKCTGCKRCETACAFYHTGKVSNHLARIKVINLYNQGIDGPVVCQQCQERYCLDCPVEAISIGAQGQIIVAPTVCILCGRCEQNCPIGAIELFNGYVFVCDLCGGDPKCVQACTEGAIKYYPKAKSPSLMHYDESTKKMNPSQKRMNFVKDQGKILRKKWREKYA